METSFNCCILHSDTSDIEIFPFPILKNNNKIFAKIDDQIIGLNKLTIGLLREFLCSGVNNSVKRKLKLWKINVKKCEIENNITENDIKQILHGEEMESQELFKGYFETELNNQNYIVSNIHIITIIPVTTVKRKVVWYLDEENIAKKEKLDLSSPESIVKFLTEDEENKRWIKTDFAKPSLLCSNVFNFEREGRNDALCKTYDYIYERYCIVKNSQDIGPKELHPLLALQSAPGGGKSFFFDELASLKDEDINLVSNYLKTKKSNHRMVEEVINLIRDSISVCVTYNGSTLYDKYGRDSNIQKGLVMRILWSYFIDGKKLGWGGFYNKFSGYFDSLDTLKAINSIILHSGKSVLLCIDEIMKVMTKDSTSDPLGNIEEILFALYLPYQELSDKAKKLHFVISTLDSSHMCALETKSQRPIKWIPIRRLFLSESVKLFRKLLENLDEERLYTIKKIISDCNGHPRTLESFCGILNDKTAIITDHYVSLIERLALSLHPSLATISLSIVRMALLGDEVSLECKIETTSGISTLRDLISSGMYINSLTEVSEAVNVVPTLSPIALQHFCVSKKIRPDDNAIAIADILQRMFVNEFLFEREVLDGKPFERFHANWELLYRELRKNKIVDLDNIYGFNDPDRKIRIKLQRKKIAYCHSEIEFPPDNDSDIYDENKIPFENLVDFLFVPKKSNNSVFDMVTFEKKEDESGYIAVNIECRFSYPNKTTRFESNDISKKYELMTNKYQEHVRYSHKQSRNHHPSYKEGMFFGKSAVGKLKMNDYDIYLVFIVWRDVGNIDYNQYNDKNIIIVDRKNLKEIYTPTLVSRPHFYSKILEEIKRT